MVNVKDYGARGILGTDDTAAFQAALDASDWPDDNGGIFIPPGLYQIDGTLTLDAGGLTSSRPFIIEGPGAMIYCPTVSSDPVLRLTDSIVSLTRVRVHGVTFYTNVARVSVELNNAELCEFNSCVFTGSDSTGIEVKGESSYNRLVNSEFSNMRRGILCTGNFQFAQIVGCSFNEQLIGGPLNWIEATNGSNPTQQLHIAGCTFNGINATLPAIRVFNGNNWTISGSNFHNCFEQAIELGQTGSSDGHVITGCNFLGGNKDDIFINGGNRNSITGCHFGVRDTQHGTVPDNTYANVHIKDPFALNAGSFNTVSGCTSDDTATHLTYMVDADGTCQNNAITGNIGAAGFNLADPSNVLTGNITA